MRDQEIVGLYEAYHSIYSNVNEEVEQLDEGIGQDVANVIRPRLEAGARFFNTNPVGKAIKGIFGPVNQSSGAENARQGKYRKEETDLFDYILEYLVAEGYADTNEAAVTIMANMSEEWRQSIVEAGEGIGREPKTPPQKPERNPVIKPGSPRGNTYDERLRNRFGLGPA